MREEFLNSPVNLIAPIVILNMCVFHENPHPLPVNRKLSRPRIVPGGDRPWPKSPHYVYERRTRGDFSRYSLLMGVLFSGAPGPPGTCHASLGSRTMLDADECQRVDGSQGILFPIEDLFPIRSKCKSFIFHRYGENRLELLILTLRSFLFFHTLVSLFLSDIINLKESWFFSWQHLFNILSQRYNRYNRSFIMIFCVIQQKTWENIRLIKCNVKK